MCGMKYPNYFFSEFLNTQFLAPMRKDSKRPEIFLLRHDLSVTASEDT
jgi:hypothetical protein